MAGKGPKNGPMGVVSPEIANDTRAAGAFAFIDLLAELVAEKVAARAGTAKPRYADKDANPYGSERAFLDAARRGDFETFRRARKVTALWVDVERAIERNRPPAKPKPAAVDDDVALLEAHGIRLRTQPKRAAR